MNKEWNQSSWKQKIGPEFNKPYMIQLKSFLKEEYQKGKTIFPRGRNYFRALELTPFEKVKVVILGQDPYHGPGQAHGLCFSVPEGIPLPPSLINIFKELHSDLGVNHLIDQKMSSPLNSSKKVLKGCLEKWALQGVLLLNTVLTVESSKPASHQNKGWEIFTDKVLSLLNEERENLVFVLWGSHAQKKGSFLNRNKHLVIEAPHPSPLSAHRGFLGSKPFSKINHFLISKNIQPIQWDLNSDWSSAGISDWNREGKNNLPQDPTPAPSAFEVDTPLPPLLTPSSGFTLLEMMITITILATLMIYTTKNIQTATKTKSKLQRQLDDMSEVRDALKIMEKDIHLTFHYRDIEREINEAIKKDLQTTVNQNQGGRTSGPNPPPVQQQQQGNILDYFHFKQDEINEKVNRQDPTTHFLGKENELYFVTMNSGKIYESTLQADFIKVGYHLKNCKNALGNESKCLFRSQSTIVEGDIDKGGIDSVLLENVSDFNLKYFIKKPDWEESWDSRINEATKKDIFPLAVQITLSTEKSQSDHEGVPGAESVKKKITMNIVARLRFPNNPTTTNN